MPTASKFLEGFQLLEGNQFDGFTLTSAHSTHKQIIRFKAYRYEITLVFINNSEGTYEELYDDLITKVEKELVIYTRYGNPYQCWIDDPSKTVVVQDGDTYTFHLVGHAERI